MKKLFYFAAAAMMLAACTSEELNVQDQQKLAEDNSAVNFDVYTLRGVTRAGTPGDIDNDNIKDVNDPHGKDGFGVFAFYTDEKEYDQTAIPNFMYNQKVVWNGSKWAYEPVKYWPNEFGDAAISDNIDYVTFFAYAPWTQFEPTTGKPVIKTGDDVTETAEHQQDYNIIGIKSNKETGDPIIKYRVDTDPATSVDLLWGVNADASTWAPIQESSATVTKNEAGYPFLNLLKPSDPVNGKIKFNLRHALAKVKITIDYIADQETPAATDTPAGSDSIDMAKTRIFVRSLEMDGFALEGALNLNNETADHPRWTDFDGKELNFDPVVFNDGRSDGKEGKDGATKKEDNAFLNPEIVENFANTTKRNDTIIFNGGYAGVADGEKNPGVRMYGSSITQLLFGGDPGTNNGYFYVIPRDTRDQKVNIKIKYGVLTLDNNLSTKLSGSTDFGSDIENIIEKTDIFNGADFEAGKQYQINIHIGMTSVKIDAVVEGWTTANDPTNVNLPDNQPEGGVTPGPAPVPASTQAILAGINGTHNMTVDADLNVTYSKPTTEDEINADIAALINAFKDAGITQIIMGATTNAFVLDNNGQFVNGSDFNIIDVLANAVKNNSTMSLNFYKENGEVDFTFNW